MISCFEEYDRELLILERIEQNTKEVTERITKEVTERITKEVTERITKEVTYNLQLEIVLKLIECDKNDDFIQFVTKLPIEEIAKIRENC